MQQTILVVDDSPTVVKFVTFSLRNCGFEVITACDGMEALEKISALTNRVDLVITDLNMPNLDGYGLIGTLRQNPKYSATPMIILSSEESDDDRDRGMAVGANAYLMKPFKSSRLLEEVRKYLKPNSTTGQREASWQS